VQECCACNTDVSLNATAPLLQLRSFTQWLAKHSGLVSSMNCAAQHRVYPVPSILDGLSHEEHLAAAQELLLVSIKAAAKQPLPAEGVSAAAPVPAPTQYSGPPPVYAVTGTARHAVTNDAHVLPGIAAANQQMQQLQQQQQQQQQQLGSSSSSSSSNRASSSNSNRACACAPSTPTCQKLLTCWQRCAPAARPNWI
jgi:hypothetical protein